MPIYEYECQQCGQQISRLQKLSDAPLADCPVCQRPALKKLLSLPGLRFKGSSGCETGFKLDTHQNLAKCGAGGSCPGCPASR
ncbi:FmdB family zinc ribbon protein [Pseudaeromonas sharmana]|uniref:FmdB family zinc ribbon protein n=1 Tax=Pseudaeromonas sharmana TaxID=328412 RepID=A0ABV8CQN8_9GAMM